MTTGETIRRTGGGTPEPPSLILTDALLARVVESGGIQASASPSVALDTSEGARDTLRPDDGSRCFKRL